MTASAVFQVKSSNIHSQVFDDEVVVMDMTTGLYFSLRGAAIEIWTAVSRGATRTDAIAALASRYSASDEAIAAAADTAIATLHQHGLIAAAPPNGEAAAPEPAAGERVPLAAPTIECFTDMQELLLLDPIHEVSEAGWPVVRDADGH
jgi:hypothetical protein